MDDALVIGAGPNGLVAAATLARRGWKVRVLEAQNRPGGALYSLQTTLPGYWHDVGAAFFPFGRVSPALCALDLERTGLEWRGSTIDSAHPAPDGSCVAISRDVERSVKSFGIDGPAWRRLHDWQARMGQRLPNALLAPLPALGPAWRLGLLNVLKLGLIGPASSGAYSRKKFQSEAARRVIPSLALHVDLGPRDFSGAALGLVLGLLAAGNGFQVPVGGARSITHAILRRLEEAGGTCQLGTHVDEIIVRQRKAVAVRTSAGEEIPVRKAILADVGAPALFLKMLPAKEVSGWLRWNMQRFRYGWGTFKMDWALSGPVPWKSGEARAAAVVHAGDSIDDLDRFTQEVRDGRLPENPYLVIGQQSLLDPSRAPAGGHTLWAYSHAPSYPAGGWDPLKQSFADRIEARIEGLAPGFRQLIRGRAIFAPDDLQAMNENLVGGDLGGGSAHFSHQLFWRPAFPYFNYRTPVRGLYLASASAHPGAGVHGACGYNAALQAWADRA